MFSANVERYISVEKSHYVNCVAICDTVFYDVCMEVDGYGSY